MKGQGSTEYLVILAVVLVVALIVIGLLGQFTGFGTSGLEQQSKSYWAGATPFAIKNTKITAATAAANGTVQLEMENRIMQKIRLENITFDGVSINTSYSTDNVTFAGGETRTMSALTVFGGVNPCSAGATSYQVNNVVITYTIVGGITGQTQRGDKALYGKCA